MIKVACNTTWIGTSSATITAIQQLCGGKQYTTYDLLRSSIPALAGLSDSAVQQCLQDAGYPTEELPDDYPIAFKKDTEIPE